MALTKVSKERLAILKQRILKEKLAVIMSSFFSIKTEDVKRWKDYDEVIDPDSMYQELDVNDGMTKLPTKEGRGQFGCKTAGCIAGHAMMEFMGGTVFEDIVTESKGRRKPLGVAAWRVDDDKIEVSFHTLGAQALGINHEQANILFYTNHWPQFFRDGYDNAIDNEEFIEANRIVAARIQWFLDFQE